MSTVEVLLAAFDDIWPHHMRGALLLVPEHADLVRLGCAMRDDDTEAVGAALQEGQLLRPSEAQVAAWGSEARWFHAVIVQPWLLVCPRAAEPPADLPQA